MKKKKKVFINPRKSTWDWEFIERKNRIFFIIINWVCVSDSFFMRSTEIRFHAFHKNAQQWKPHERNMNERMYNEVRSTNDVHITLNLNHRRNNCMCSSHDTAATTTESWMKNWKTLKYIKMSIFCDHFESPNDLQFLAFRRQCSYSPHHNHRHELSDWDSRSSKPLIWFSWALVLSLSLSC